MFTNNQIANPPTYRIHGDERRKLKKELSLMKSSHKMFWFCEDTDRVMGGGMSDNAANQYLTELKEKINKLEDKLSIKNDREQKLERTLGERYD